MYLFCKTVHLFLRAFVLTIPLISYVSCQPHSISSYLCCLCMCGCMCVCVCVCVWMCVCVCVCVCVCLCECVSVCLCLCVCECAVACMHACMHMCVHMHAYLITPVKFLCESVLMPNMVSFKLQLTHLDTHNQIRNNDSWVGFYTLPFFNTIEIK